MTHIVNIAEIGERLSSYIEEDNGIDLTRLIDDVVFVAKQACSLEQFLLVTLQIWSTMQIVGAKQ